jgi:DNA invertase Pin-like site-specific DNA recombinase
MEKVYSYPLKTFGYARVSTIDQDLSLQRAALLRYGVEPDNIIEDKASGATMTRPGMKNLIRAMRPGDTVVVWKLDRLGRTLPGIIEIGLQMEQQDIKLVSITEQIDTKTAMGRMFFHVIAAMAQLERDLISERTKAGMEVAKARGAKFGPSHSIKDNIKRMEVAREIVEEGVDGITAEEAVARLNAADPKAKPIKSLETWRRWVREGCPGVDD